MLNWTQLLAHIMWCELSSMSSAATTNGDDGDDGDDHNSVCTHEKATKTIHNAHTCNIIHEATILMKKLKISI